MCQYHDSEPNSLSTQNTSVLRVVSCSELFIVSMFRLFLKEKVGKFCSAHCKGDKIFQTAVLIFSLDNKKDVDFK